MMDRDVGTTLRAVSALRDLCLGLPHVPTPAEAAKLRRFEILAASPGGAGDADADALLAGWRAWWRRGRTTELLTMARALPRRLVHADRRLASYEEAAAQATAGTTRPERAPRVD